MSLKKFFCFWYEYFYFTEYFNILFTFNKLKEVSLRNLALTLGLVFIIASNSFSSGFQINEHGARAMAMGGAFVGLVNDPAAVYYNPAGIVNLSGTRLSLGATLIVPMSTFKGPDPSTTETSLEKQFFNPVNLYFTQQITDELFFGFSLNNPFGLGTKWPENWVGRYRTTETEIRTFNFSPNFAYKITDQFSIGAGFVVSYADVLIARKLQLTPPLPDADLELSGDNTSFGFRAGLFFKATEELSFGLSYHSNVVYNFEGDAKSKIYPPTPNAVLNALPKGKIEAKLKTPFVATFGSAYKMENLTLAFDFQFNQWASYKELKVKFKEYPNQNGSESVSKREFKNSFIIRGGSEYLMDKLALRGGLFYDKNPIKDERLDPTLPDADRIGINLGFGYKITEQLSVDVSYLYLYFFERKIDSSDEFIPVQPTPIRLNGTYTSSAHLIGLNLNYNF